ncbi:ATP-binding protein [Streptomyces sp. NPDC057638]|uniref:ATP-binding protein n=1 Tax=Streptomyces sp. NPDC057638 TaxID=3346190 RepID=UPI0036C3A030
MIPAQRLRTDERAFTSSPTSVGLAREFTAKALLRWGLESLTDDIRLSVSELASNAVLHGDGHEFVIRLTSDNHSVRLEVQDGDPRWPTLRLPSENAISGRGLHLVAALSDVWGVDGHLPTGKIVWARFEIVCASHEPPEHTSPPEPDRGTRA